MIFFQKKTTFMDKVSDGLMQAEPVFRIVNPGIPNLFPARFAKIFFRGVSWGKSMHRVWEGKPLDEELGERLGKRIISIKPIKRKTIMGHINITKPK